MRQRLLKWNFIIDKNSVEASVYVTWEKKILANLKQQLIPLNAQPYLKSISLRKAVAWMTEPGGPLPNISERNKFVIQCLEEALTELQTTLGPDTSKWIYGQEKIHYVLIKHPLSNAVDEATRKLLESGPMPRSGNGSTPGVTAGATNQISGASFRMVIDAADWDKSMFTNSPGQSGDPRSPYYRNLFRSWATDQHFPVYFSRDRVEGSMREKTVLQP
jgi:penicillin amidase